MPGLSFITYFDTLLIVIGSISILSYPKKNKEIAFENPSAGFQPEIPIKFTEEDILDRKAQADAATHKLLQTRTHDGAFTLGIIAPWGAGKTSFMNLMKQVIQKDVSYKDDTIIIDFNPWTYDSRKSISQVFFEILDSNISHYNKDIRKYIKQYSKGLTQTGNIWSLLLHNILHNNESLINRFSSLSSQIKNLEKRIVVFIDDIDRLSLDEIQEVFKLVRNTSNFPNMYFVLAFDKYYVLDTLQSSFSKKTINYTEKILQEEILLLPIKEEQFREFLKKKLVEILEESDYIEALHLINKENIFHNFKLSDYLKSLRSINRLLNNIKLNYPRIKGEVKFDDYLLFEIFKLCYPILSEFFIKNFEYILTEERGLYKLYQSSTSANKQSKFSEIFGYSKPIDIFEYIKNYKNELFIEDTEIENVKGILNLLFGSYRSIPDVKGINNSQYTHIYMINTLLESDLSDIEFNKTMSMPFAEIKGKIEEWSKYKSYSLSRHLFSSRIKEKAYLQKVIRSMFYLGSLNRAASNGPDQLNRAIIELRTYNKNNEYSENDRSFVYETLIENGYTDFLAYYLHYLFKTTYNWDYIIERDSLIEIQEQLFLKYAEEKHSFDEKLQVWYALRHTEHIDNGNNTYYDREISPKESINCIRTIILENIECFIPHTIRQSQTSGNYCLTECIDDIYGDLDSFYKIICNLSESETLLEYRTFLEIFLKKENNDYIAFDFKTIKLK